MPYREEVFTTPDYREVKKYFCYRLGGKGNRIPSARKTPPAIEEANRKRREEKLFRLILTNFGRDDLYVTLTYRDEPTYEDGKRAMKNFLLRLRRAYKKKGLELKYIYTTEYRGERLHHHLIINDGVTRAECEVLWGQGLIPYHGFRRYDGRPEDAKAVAAYMIKETGRMPREYSQLSYVASRNLKPPKVVKRTIYSSRWRERPKPPQGMELVDVINLTTDDGYPMQKAIFRRRGRQIE